MTFDLPELRRVFHFRGPKRGRGSFRQSLERIHYCLSNGLLTLQEQDYDWVSPPPITDKLRTVYNVAMSSNQSAEHGELKWLAWNWCFQTEGVAADFETGGVWGRRVDVAGPPGTICIECGNSNPEHCYTSYFDIPFQCLRERPLSPAPQVVWKRFAVFPFQPPLARRRAYIFEPTEKGYEALSRFVVWSFANWLRRNQYAAYGDALAPYIDPPDPPANLGADSPARLYSS